MTEARLQTGIDFGASWVDVCLLNPAGEPLLAHQRFLNALPGYEAVKQLLVETLTARAYTGLDISGEATGMYWLPFFLHLASDPDLAAYDPQLYLLNPRWVAWFKKCFAQDDKSDLKDPYYIAERTRVRRPPVAWQADPPGLALRSYTRYRFHLVEALAREKCFFCAYLFLQANAYRRLKPFSDTFGVTSRAILQEDATLEQLAALPVGDLAARLSELSHGHLPQPDQNAVKLQPVARESFSLDPQLAQAIQHILTATLAHITFLEGQIQQAEAWITTALAAYPPIQQLLTLPGYGPVYSAGVGAEIGAVHRFLAGQKWDRQRTRYRPKNLRDAEDAIAKIAGLWWPQSQSGSFAAEDRHMSTAANRYLRYYLIQGADHLRKRVPEFQRFYARKYAEVPKHKHKRALVLTARKSIGVIVGLLHRNEPYRSEEERRT
ncbi:MAG TPA: transposase [Anaerolineae bacterium]|nr:transposase [Anaerolineae bacterium]HQI84972.1 transposase [Anaerolineae bacterium]